MRWTIAHRTEYTYGVPAKESFNQVRLQPMNTADQTIEQFKLNVFPATTLRHYRDFYANVVHHFEIPEPHAQLVIESEVQAVTHPLSPLAEGVELFPLQRIGEAARTLRCH